MYQKLLKSHEHIIFTIFVRHYSNTDEMYLLHKYMKNPENFNKSQRKRYLSIL